MPELPEVETTRRGIAPYLKDRKINDVEIREQRMRWPVEDTVTRIAGHTVRNIERRAKYLFLRSDPGTLIIHLGMSGSLRICTPDVELKKHDHLIVSIDGGLEMRLHDPRRFGAVLWHDHADGEIHTHHLIRHLGPEPLGNQFHGPYLWDTCHGRKTSIKQHIMNGKVVVGVGNIYACEALFRSGIRPTKRAGLISKKRATTLAREIRNVLDEAIRQGGTTLRDFLHEDGQPGYFKQKLNVYDREGKPCRKCGAKVKRIVISNRSTFYCPQCQG